MKICTRCKRQYSHLLLNCPYCYGTTQQEKLDVPEPLVFRKEDKEKSKHQNALILKHQIENDVKQLVKTKYPMVNGYSLDLDIYEVGGTQ